MQGRDRAGLAYGVRSSQQKGFLPALVHMSVFETAVWSSFHEHLRLFFLHPATIGPSLYHVSSGLLRVLSPLSPRVVGGGRTTVHDHFVFFPHLLGASEGILALLQRHHVRVAVLRRFSPPAARFSAAAWHAGTFFTNEKVTFGADRHDGQSSREPL